MNRVVIRYWWLCINWGKWCLNHIFIWNVNYAWTTAFIFDSRTVFTWKCRSFRDRKCLENLGGLEPPTFGFMPKGHTIDGLRHVNCKLLGNTCVYMCIDQNYISHISFQVHVFYLCHHCSDVIMSAIASQITCVSIVYPTVCSDVYERKH